MKTYIGDGVYIRPITHGDGPYWDGAPDIVGYIIGFDRPDGDCEGYVGIWKGADDVKYDRPIWKVEQSDPLTLSPSILCPHHPEEHGFIRNGKWVKT